MTARKTPDSAPQYQVARPFRHVDYRTGEATSFEPGDTFTEAIQDYHLSKEGPDGHGPLLVDPNAPAGDEDADVAATPTDQEEN